jgi:hypothetical protein
MPFKPTAADRERALSKLKTPLAATKNTLNSTNVLFTINANQAVSDRTQYEEMIEGLNDLITNVLQNEDLRAQVFGNQDVVPEVKVTSLSFEIGDRYHRLHAHLTVDIQHQVGAYSVKKLRDRLKAVLDEYGQHITPGFHVNTQYKGRSEAAFKNYATKERRKANNLAVLEREDVAEEVERLSDDMLLLKMKDDPEGYLAKK